MTELKVFEGACDWVIAEDLEDVARVLKEHTGYTPEEDELADFEEVDLDDYFTLFFIDSALDDKPPESEYPEGAQVYFEDDEDQVICWHARATYRQWAGHLGRAFLGSTEY